MPEASSASSAALSVNDLQAWFRTPDGIARAVDGVSFEIAPGEVFALVGESGCGKSATALAIMGLLPKPGGYIAGGSICLGGQDLAALSADQRRRLRGNRMSMIFQEPMTSLNPVMPVGDQVAEVLRLHHGVNRCDARDRTIELFEQVRLPAAAQRYREYPHQLSGGMKQRVVIAMALAGEPELLIADEPTTALDVTIQAQVLDLLLQIRDRKQTAILLVTHDMGVVSEYADRVAVMYTGRLVEIAPTRQILRSPQHPYTSRLLESLPGSADRGRDLATIPGAVPPATQYGDGCRFLDRCPLGSVDPCGARAPVLADVAADHRVACYKAGTYRVSADRPVAVASTGSDRVLLAAREVCVHFPVRRGPLQRLTGKVYAVDGLTLSVRRGVTTALVGESGCGKTTFGRAIVGLTPLTAGDIQFDGQPLASCGNLHRRVQIIFQDPYASLNPRMRIGDILREGPRIHRLPWNRERLTALLEMVSLPADAAARYPHEFSGGQRQRIAIARALSVDPEFIICDEATSALDVSVQAQILNLLRDLQQRLGLTYLLITHDLSVVEYLADELAVMYLGRVVESGPAPALLAAPHHPYTQALLTAVPRVDSDSGRRALVLDGDVPSPMAPPPGCHFHPRCAFAEARCRERQPPLQAFPERHQSCCIRPYGPASSDRSQSVR